MKYRRLTFALSIAALVAGSTEAFAQNVCTDWDAASDGTQVRTCVDDNGRQFCQQKKGDAISEVSCD